MPDGDLSLLVNGEPRVVPANTTVAGLVSRLDLDTVRVAVAVNREVVPRSAYG